MALTESFPAQTLFEMTNDAVFVVESRSGGIGAANPAAARLIDRAADRLRGAKLRDFLAKADRPLAAKGFAAVVEAGPDRLIEVRLRRADGSEIPCEVSGRFWGGHTVLVFRDLSERMRALEDIHLRNVAIASVGSGVTIADARHPDLPLIYVNRGFEQITGFSAKEAVGRSCRFLQADDRDQAALEVLRAALKKGAHCNVRLRNYRKDGTLFWNELHISPVRTESGELTHFVGIQIDVTERVLARERLEASEQRYRMLADNIEDLILRTHPDGRIDFVSPPAQQFFGCGPAQLEGADYLRWVHPEDRAALTAHWRQLATAPTPETTISYRLVPDDRAPIWVESSDTLHHDPAAPGGPFVISVVRDVTLRKRAEEEIRRALEREKQLNEFKTRFIRMVSHEFRTPMTGIGASASFLRDFAEQLPAEKRARHFRNIETALKRMNEMLDDVLFVSRSDAGRVEFKPRPLDLRAYAEDIVEQLHHIHGEGRIDLDCRLPEEAAYLLDPALVNHIIVNLLTNALKYSPAAETVEFRISERADQLRIEVRDHGIGIPEADQASLFEPFHRAHNVGTIKGTGLGLHIVKKSVERHGGLLEFTSHAGRGTRFIVHLPARIPATAEALSP